MLFIVPAIYHKVKQKLFNILYHNIMWGTFGWEKIGEFANHELFAKIFLTNIHGYTKNVFGICTDLAYSPNFPLPIALPVWFTKNFPA